MSRLSTGLRLTAWVAASAILVGTFSFSPLPRSAAAPAASSTIVLANGGDVSWLAQIEREGSKFLTTAGKRVDPLVAMKSAGLTIARLRLWVEPSSQDSSLKQVLAMAKRIKKAKLEFVLDLHYSDWWADPANQRKPAAWQGLSGEKLQERVRSYTHQTLQAFVSQGTAPAWVQVGNEIANGMLWPDGQLSSWTADRFAALAGLVNAGIDGVHSASPKSRVMIHLETGGDSEKTRGWLARAFAAGLDRPDAIGLSYYSLWAGSLTNLVASIEVVATEYQLRVAIAETAYPNSAATMPTPLLDPAKARLSGYSLSAAGQAAYVTNLAALLRRSAGSRAVGIWWWEVFSPNRANAATTSAPSAIMYSSLVTPTGAPNRAMLALGAASRK